MMWPLVIGTFIVAVRVIVLYQNVPVTHHTVEVFGIISIPFRFWEPVAMTDLGGLTGMGMVSAEVV